MRSVRIGSGAGYGGDRLEPALDLIRRGNLDYLIFECLAERTIALAQLEKRHDPSRGYNSLFEYRMTAVLDALRRHPVKIITNMGAANPEAAARKTLELARAAGLLGLKVACVTGDDVLSRLSPELTIWESGQPLSTLGNDIISANAYLGCDGILEALNAGADIVITGRVADPALVLGPLRHAFGWAADDYDRLGKGILAGHLLECAGQVTGGYFADPGVKDVPELWNLGFPIAEVGEDGSLVITKLPGTGGLVSEATCQEQILYEIQDPTSYFTPDCTADFSGVTDAADWPPTAWPSPARPAAPTTGCIRSASDIRTAGLARAKSATTAPPPKRGPSWRARLSAAVSPCANARPVSCASTCWASTRSSPRSPTRPSPWRSACAWPPAAPAAPTPRWWATRWRRSTPTAPEAAAAPSNPSARLSLLASVFLPGGHPRTGSALGGYRMKLRELAHSRTGDKGNISVISVIAWHAEDYRPPEGAGHGAGSRRIFSRA